MGKDGSEVVRSPMALTTHPRRRLEERLGLRFPRLLEALGGWVWRLPPRSRLRRALARRFLRMALEAFNRGDLAAAFLLYHPECECIWDPRFPSVGVESTITGKEERIRAQQRVLDDWRELRLIPTELIQLGDRMVLVGHMRGKGLSSGVAVETEWLVDFTVRGGRVVHERITANHQEGLAAAGLSRSTAPPQSA